MLLLFAFKPGPNWVGTLTVGPVTMDWDEWAFLLNTLLLSLTLLSSLLMIRFGRWWLTVPIALVTAYAGLTVPMNPKDNFNDSWHGFVLVLPIVIVHAVVSFAMPRRKPRPAEPVRRYNSP